MRFVFARLAPEFLLVSKEGYGMGVVRPGCHRVDGFRAVTLKEWNRAFRERLLMFSREQVHVSGIDDQALCDQGVSAE